MNRKKISCFIIVCNEADRIESCLKPLQGWVDQLIVLDSGSTDNTVEIAEKYADKVYQTDWPGFGPQRNRALGYCQYDWVMNIDADEIVSEALKQEIDDTLSHDIGDVTMLEIPWHTYLFGKPLKRGRYASPQGKIFLKAGANFKDRSVHESLEMPIKKIKVLNNALAHYSWRDYYHAQEKHLKYGVLGAQEKRKKGKKSSLSFAVLRFFVDFTQQYIFRLGFLDGKRGFLMAIILGQYAFHKYAALWSIEQQEKHP